MPGRLPIRLMFNQSVFVLQLDIKKKENVVLKSFYFFTR